MSLLTYAVVSAAPSPPPAAADARLARELFDLKARVEAGFEDLAARMAAMQDALTAAAARADAADRRAEALDAAARADRLALAAVLDPLDDLRATLGPDAPLAAPLAGLAAAQLAALARAGVDEVPALGAPFDPRLHEGVGARPVPAGAAAGTVAGTVIEVVRRGFRWQGQVLRRAQVLLAE